MPGTDDPKDPRKKQPGEKPPGKQHYNPVNMSGKEAGIFKQHEKEAETSDRDEPRGSGKQRDKG